MQNKENIAWVSGLVLLIITHYVGLARYLIAFIAFAQMVRYGIIVISASVNVNHVTGVEFQSIIFDSIDIKKSGATIPRTTLKNIIRTTFFINPPCLSKFSEYLTCAKEFSSWGINISLIAYNLEAIESYIWLNEGFFIISCSCFSMSDM
ncbi:TPA: hypothetical protein MFM44_003356 [Klebsiella pneumoniae]|uniref:hypothetical protein n=1 Tax=Klebsiella pneumoniae TaxID=573 RepID=UPI0011E7A53B|nr:hypothetical protein [Klebsiella pneumoniae]HBQ0450220.1 hypothetical protein [Klebsiella pneumoniae]HBW3342744.1 hypothetical protein [Klebsiella pneumoniae]HBW8457515.1 hypothetical protein [Klebsiella pneumoniae]HBW8479929.1 hypothetical protein [Klebsiella pneumoniae]HCQ9395777.1 hypothetical protein [Klebsiella pneumoniae]